MEITHKLKVILLLTPITLLTFFVIFIYFYRKRRLENHQQQKDIEKTEDGKPEDEIQGEDLITFQGGEELTIFDILDAPGEVIGKSSYGTLYKAFLQQSNSVRLLRFLRPVCATKADEFEEAIRFLGCVRHPNLVPLLGFYSGPRGEKLLIHPFYRHGNLAQFIRDSNGQSHKWETIYKVSVGIAKGLDHLHSGLQKPMIHGNLSSKNILLDRPGQPYISDFGLHLLLNPTVGQEMLEALASQGYKAPELIKMKDGCEQTDIYSLGVILLELLTGKEPINENPTAPHEDFYLPNFMRNAVLGRRISDLFHPSILISSSDGESPVTKERILKVFQLAMACCSPSPSLRPNSKQILRKLEEIGK
ncbi:putative kinase-like protein TMKL1 [Ziziphus jujuba]|uniref:Kinase-like protein TMKL1 n=1 Tax=Ziziphus jujuba TaxID=326968 RepID=A0A6P3YSC8_ZIZJJ|nr:putative kinase-like protein TMKL1 [Ziziphus jujuba]